MEELAAWLERTFPGGIDILVNNAGMAYKVRCPQCYRPVR